MSRPVNSGRKCSRGHVFQGSDPCPLCWPGYRTFAFRTKVWLYPGEAAWHFITVPKKSSDVIRERFQEFKRGWGSLPVRVKISGSEWKTSIFPDKKRGAYLLPLKTSVRKNEGIRAGDVAKVSLHILV